MDLKLKNNNKLTIHPFTKLEYIECTGTQWIDTGILPSLNNDILVEVAFPQSPAGNKSLFGSQTSGNGSTSFDFGQEWGGKLRIGISFNSQLITLDTNYHIYEYRKSENATYIDNVKGFTPSNYTPGSANLIVGGINFNNAAKSLASGKIKRVIIKNSNQSLVELYPALDFNNVVCMYDTVSQSFFYNQGTGVFNAGPIIYKAIPGNILLCNTLFHQNTPYINGYDTMKLIMNYQKEHQDEVKEKYYPTTQLWSNIISTYPEIVQYYNLNHKICVFICDSNNPEQCTENFLQIIEDYPSLVPVIENNPSILSLIFEWDPIIHNLVDTGNYAYLENTGSGAINTKFAAPHGFRIVSTVKLKSNGGGLNDLIGANSFGNNNMVRLSTGGISPSLGGHAHSYGSISLNRWYSIDVSNANNKYNVTCDNVVLANNVSQSGNYPSNELVIFQYNTPNGIVYGQPFIGCICRTKLYDENNTLVRDFCPFYRNGVYGVIDLIDHKFYSNVGSTNFVYSTELKS